MPVTQSEQQLLGRIGGYKSWANTADRTARTAPGRAAFLARHADAPDPEAAKRQYFSELSLKAARARRARKAGERDNAGPKTGAAHFPTTSPATPDREDRHGS